MLMEDQPVEIYIQCKHLPLQRLIDVTNAIVGLAKTLCGK